MKKKLLDLAVWVTGGKKSHGAPFKWKKWKFQEVLNVLNPNTRWRHCCWSVLFWFSHSFQSLLQVSWVRHRDIHLLTVGRYTYTSDQRFRAIHHPHSEDWILQIKYPQHRDSGIYECQVRDFILINNQLENKIYGSRSPILGCHLEFADGRKQ